MMGVPDTTGDGSPRTRARLGRCCLTVVLVAIGAFVLLGAASSLSAGADAAGGAGPGSLATNDTAGELAAGELLSSTVDNERSRVEAQIAAETTDRKLSRAGTDDQRLVAIDEEYRRIDGELTALELELDSLQDAWSRGTMTTATYAGRETSIEIRIDALRRSTTQLRRTLETVPVDVRTRQRVSMDDVDDLERRIEHLETERLEGSTPSDDPWHDPDDVVVDPEDPDDPDDVVVDPDDPDEVVVDPDEPDDIVVDPDDPEDDGGLFDDIPFFDCDDLGFVGDFLDCGDDTDTDDDVFGDEFRDGEEVRVRDEVRTVTTVRDGEVVHVREEVRIEEVVRDGEVVRVREEVLLREDVEDGGF